MTLPTASKKSRMPEGIYLFEFDLFFFFSNLVSCTSSNQYINPFYSTLFPNLTSQQQQQLLLTQLLFSGKNIFINENF
jgi:hypothetical protein